MVDNEMFWDADLHDQIANLGAELGPNIRDATTELWLPLHRTEPLSGVVRDVHYGPHEHQVLDIHCPPAVDGSPRPVFCYVHGGGFVGGDKSKLGQPFYDNVGRWAVSSGFLCVNINYRLAPEFSFPAGAEDVVSALAWVESSIDQFGGDVSRVVVMGHSAGGAHVATCAAFPELRKPLRRVPAAFILSSGVYDPSLGANAYAMYYGEDASLLHSYSTIPGICELEVPLLVTGAQFDPPGVHLQTAELLAAYARQRGRLPEFVQADGHNHYSVVYQFDTKETWFTDRIRRFVRSIR